MNRNAAIDFSRAFAIILVTLSHVSRGPWLPSLQFGSFDLFGFLQNGWIGVGIFFVISGYCMGISSKNEFSTGVSAKKYCTYLAKRFLRIAPAYYISIFIWVLIINHYHISPKNTALRDVVTHLSFTHNLLADTFFSISGVYWSIAVEMQFYLLLPLIVVLCRELKRSLIVLFFTFLLSIIITYSHLSIVIKWSVFNYLCLFVLGFLMFKFQYEIQFFLDKTKAFPIFIFFFFLMLFYKGEEYGNDQKSYESLMSILYGFIMVGARSFMSNIKHPVFDAILLIGKASFSIYLYNYIFSTVMPRGNNYFAMVFMVLGTFSFGIMMYFLIEYHTEKYRSLLFKKLRD